MKFIKMMLICLLITGVANGQSAFDIEWWSSNTGTGMGSDTLKQWAEGMEGRVGVGGGGYTSGSTVYVNSNVAIEGDGTSWTNAKDTLDEAIGLVDGNDVIKIAANSTFTMGAAADEVDVDVGRLLIIGEGEGLSMPVFDYTGTVTGAFAVGADHITFVNLRFHANVPDVNDAVEIEAGSTGITFIDCVFDVETAGTDEFHECISSDSAGNHYLKIIGCEFRMGAGAARSAIEFRDCDYAQIVGNKFSGDYAIADVNNATTASDHITIAGNEVMNGTIGGAAGLNAQPCVELKTDTSGTITSNVLLCNVATPDAAIVGADMYVIGNTYSETEGGASAAPMWLTTDTLDNKIGVDDVANLGTTANVTADVDGSILERLEALSARQLGTTLIAGKSYTFSAATASVIATTSSLFTVAGGPIRITDFYGIVTTEIGATNMLIQGIDTVTSTTFPFSTDVACDSDVVGTTYTFSAAVPSVLVPLAGPQNLANRGAALNWYMPAGTVDQLGDGAVAGVIVWYMTFVPLVEGVTVVDAT